MMVAVLQDVFAVVALSEDVAGWLEGWVVGKLTGELGMKLSQNKAASKPFAEFFLAIGARFDLSMGSTMVMPNTPVVETLRAVVSAWKLGKMARWEVDDVERFAGLVSYIVAFLDSRKARQAWWGDDGAAGDALWGSCRAQIHEKRGTAGDSGYTGRL